MQGCFVPSSTWFHLTKLSPFPGKIHLDTYLNDAYLSDRRFRVRLSTFFLIASVNSQSSLEISPDIDILFLMFINYFDDFGAFDNIPTVFQAN